jgi:hypothetical protein
MKTTEDEVPQKILHGNFSKQNHLFFFFLPKPVSEHVYSSTLSI